MRINKKLSVAIVSLLVAVGALVVLNVTGTDAQALGTTSTRRDCTDEDIIHCGALTQTELLQDYDKNDGDVKAIFSHFGITRSDLASNDMKMGKLKLDGTIVVDGKTVATNAQSTYRIRTKAAATTFVVNGKTYYKLPVSGVYWKEADVFVMFKDGKFFQAVQTSCGNIITATPVTPPAPKPQPVYSCDKLTMTKIDRTRFSFSTAATAKNGAQIVSYTYYFGDGIKQTTGATVEHTYAKPGTYTAYVNVNVKVNGSNAIAASGACRATVKVEAVPVKPLYACNSLTARIVKSETRTYEYTLGFTAEGGASLLKVDYDFGDNTSATYDAAKATKVQHSYAKAGSYRTVATLHFTVKNGAATDVKDVNCEASINTPPVETPPTPTTPTELPQTGAGSVLGGSLGLGLVAAAGYYWMNSRKNLVSTLLNK